MIELLRSSISRFLKNISIIKMPLYFLVASMLFNVLPTFAMTVGLRFMLSVVLAPVVLEVIQAAIALSVIGFFRVFGMSFPINERILENALIEDNENRAIEAMNRITSVEELVSAGIRMISGNSSNAIFNALLARLTALNPEFAAHNQNQLLRAAVFHKRTDVVNTLLANNAVRNNAHANNNEALKEACISGNKEILEALLALETVRENANHNNNEALRVAQRYERWEIMEHLLSIPKVTEHFGVESSISFSERNETHFGTTAVQVQPDQNNAAVQQPLAWWESALSRDLHVREQQDTDLQQIGRNSESSMTRLNQRQNQAFTDMQARYQAQFNQKGQQAIFNEIRRYLRTEYERNPAQTYFNITLPYNIGVFNWFVNNTPFYEHRAHTAYRYLFLEPNPWRALYGRSNELTNASKTNIAYMWLAATDKSQKLPEGITRESLLAEFTQSIYELCRAHNYDRVRPVMRAGQVVNEHYDDLEGDKPTCGMGTAQRILQFYMVFLNERPETRPLTDDVIRKKFIEDMLNESTVANSICNKLKNMGPSIANQIHDIVVKQIVLDDVSDKELALLKQIEFTEEEIDAYVDECKKYYGPVRITQNTPLQLRSSFFASYEALIRHYAKTAIAEFSDHIIRNIKTMHRPAQNVAPVLRFSAGNGASVQQVLEPKVDASNDSEPSHSNARKIQ